MKRAGSLLRSAPSALDLRLRVLAATLRPAARFARILRVPLDDLHDLVTSTYLEELRARGSSQTAIAARIGKSRRTVATLSRAAADKESLLRWGEPIASTHAVAALCADGARRTLAEIEKALHRRRGTDVRRAVELLVEQDVLRTQGAKYVLSGNSLVFDQAEINARITSLDTLLAAVSDAVEQRFFAPSDAAAPALARFFEFHATPQALATLQKAIVSLVRELVTQADASAEEGGVRGVSARVALTIAPAPPAK